MPQMTTEFLALYPKEALLFFLREIGEYTTLDDSRTKKELLHRIVHIRRFQEKIRDLLEANPIWRDSKFVDCWDAAFPQDGTVCMKTSFGACAYDKTGALVDKTNNKRIGVACDIPSPLCNDEDGCIRNRITTRMDQTIGECNHSIVWLLAKLFERGFTPSSLPDLDIYEVGFLVSEGGKPWVRKVENYTCLYCVRIFLTFQLRTVWGVVDEKEQAQWHALSVEKDYAELAQKERAERGV